MALIAALFLAGAPALPAAAQQADPALGPRVEKLEKEMRAVQRKVFPGANPQYFEPEIAAAQPPAPPAGTPATSPLADLTARVDALEQELSRMTGQVEQNSFKLRQLEDAMNKFKGDAEFRLNALEGHPAPPAGAAATPPATAPAPTPGLASPPKPFPPAPTPAPAPAPATSPPPPAGPTASTTGDPAEDAYLAAYRLWEARKYPEAATALKAFVAKYPNHKRASYAQNLLGRAYLDDGKPALAAEAFYGNYQKMPRGERAPDSLYYLGQALVQLKKPTEACKVYDELQDVYGATLAPALKSKVVKGRADAKCST
jgi:TolA-binding protein